MENVDSCLHPLVQPHVSRCFVGIKTAPKWLMIPMNSTPFISLFHHQFRSEITFVTSGDQYWRENQPFKFRSMTFLVSTPRKNMKVNGKDYPILIMEKQMFETPNQIMMLTYTDHSSLYFSTCHLMENHHFSWEISL